MNSIFKQDLQKTRGRITKQIITYCTINPFTLQGTLLVAQLVGALCYKPEDRGFDSRWCQWNFSLT
jgi:hypothetical protein